MVYEADGNAQQKHVEDKRPVVLPVFCNTLSCPPRRPATHEDGDEKKLQNRWFLDPIVRGTYPTDVVADLASVSELGWVRDGDLRSIGAPVDFLGINYYTRHVARAGAFPGAAAVELDRPEGLRTASGWGVDPEGLVEVLTRVHDEYTQVPLFVTENGSAFYDPPVAENGRVDDPLRQSYLRSHIAAVRNAIADGCDVRGYYAWSLLDNLEWALGYSKRFGLIHVNYETLQRTPKESSKLYRRIIESNGEIL